MRATETSILEYPQGEVKRGNLCTEKDQIGDKTKASAFGEVAIFVLQKDKSRVDRLIPVAIPEEEK